MIVSPAFSARRYAVLGLARSGQATVAALRASGADVTAWDDNEGARDATASMPGVDRARAGALNFADPRTHGLSGYEALVVSPGVPLNRHPAVLSAQAQGVSVIGDIELFARARATLPAHRVVGITGTNGKSTTTALLHHMCETAGVPSLAAGNIGLPILGRDPLPEGGVYVLELSSFQLDLCQSLACDVAVLTNVTPDHLDRYTDFAGYAAAKARLFAMQMPGGIRVGEAIVVGEDAASREIASRYGVSARAVLEGLAPTQALSPALSGPHNRQNAAAAVAAARALGLPEAAIAEALAGFSGLPHRMERVRTHEGVLFVNDSKATNPDAVAPALAAFPAVPRPIVHWIVGGQAKGPGLGACADRLDHVKAAYVIGEAGDQFADLLSHRVAVERCGTLPNAVRVAAAQARPGDVVLLSPACASFDQFRDFEARGQAFRDCVMAL